MKIYKVRAWVNERIKRGRNKGSIVHPYKSESVFVKLKGAKNEFKNQVNEIKTWDLYGYDCHVEFFIPHIFEDGSLAYWPDENKYIEIYPEQKEK